MKYFHLNPEESNESAVVAKLSTKAEKIVQQMSKLAQKHRELDRKLVSELAKVNNLPEDEIQDMMADYDWLVDVSQYGLGNMETAEGITKEEFLKLRKKRNGNFDI